MQWNAKCPFNGDNDVMLYGHGNVCLAWIALDYVCLVSVSRYKFCKLFELFFCKSLPPPPPPIYNTEKIFFITLLCYTLHTNCFTPVTCILMPLTIPPLCGLLLHSFFCYCPFCYVTMLFMLCASARGHHVNMWSCHKMYLLKCAVRNSKICYAVK